MRQPVNHDQDIHTLTHIHPRRHRRSHAHKQTCKQIITQKTHTDTHTNANTQTHTNANAHTDSHIVNSNQVRTASSFGLSQTSFKIRIVPASTDSYRRCPNSTMDQMYLAKLRVWTCLSCVITSVFVEVNRRSSGMTSSKSSPFFPSMLSECINIPRKRYDSAFQWLGHAFIMSMRIKKSTSLRQTRFSVRTLRLARFS